MAYMPGEFAGTAHEIFPSDAQAAYGLTYSSAPPDASDTAAQASAGTFALLKSPLKDMRHATIAHPACRYF